MADPSQASAVILGAAIAGGTAIAAALLGAVMNRKNLRDEREHQATLKRVEREHQAEQKRQEQAHQAIEKRDERSEQQRRQEVDRVREIYRRAVELGAVYRDLEGSNDGVRWKAFNERWVSVRAELALDASDAVMQAFEHYLNRTQRVETEKARDGYYDEEWVFKNEYLDELVHVMRADLTNRLAGGSVGVTFAAIGKVEGHARVVGVAASADANTSTTSATASG